MRILMLLDHPFPPDIRVENETAALVKAGHEVHLLCTDDRRSGAELPEIMNGLVVHSVPPLPRDLPLWKRRLINLPLLWFVNARWLTTIAALVRREGPFDVLHVHDLPLVRTARLAARFGARAAVVADLHENYPMVLPYYRQIDNLPSFRRDKYWFRRYKYSTNRWARYERRSVARCPVVIAVVDEMRDRLSAIGVARERIAVVENFVDVDRFLSYPVDTSLGKRFAGRFVITYTGVFGRTRGLDMAIRAMRNVVELAPEALLLLVGTGPIEGDLVELTHTLDLEDHVHFEGRVPFNRIPSYLSVSDVCILPLVKSVQTDAGLAHKLFQYMLMGKPVIATDCVATRRVVVDAACGVLCPPEDDEAFAEAIVSLRAPSARAALGLNGQRAVLDRYNWKAASARLTSLYQELDRSGETDQRLSPGLV